MTEIELSAMRREDHAAIAVLGTQLTHVSNQLGQVQAALATNTKRVEELEALVRAGTWTVRILGSIGGVALAALGLWPIIREWLKGQMQ